MTAIILQLPLYYQSVLQLLQLLLYYYSSLYSNRTIISHSLTTHSITQSSVNLQNRTGKRNFPTNPVSRQSSPLALDRPSRPQNQQPAPLQPRTSPGCRFRSRSSSWTAIRTLDASGRDALVSGSGAAFGCERVHGGRGCLERWLYSGRVADWPASACGPNRNRSTRQDFQLFRVSFVDKLAPRLATTAKDSFNCVSGTICCVLDSRHHEQVRGGAIRCRSRFAVEVLGDGSEASDQCQGGFGT